MQTRPGGVPEGVQRIARQSAGFTRASGDENRRGSRGAYGGRVEREEEVGRGRGEEVREGEARRGLEAPLPFSEARRGIGRPESGGKERKVEGVEAGGTPAPLGWVGGGEAEEEEEEEEGEEEAEGEDPALTLGARADGGAKK